MVPWRELVLNNCATPRAKFCLWLALWNRLPTKYRLNKFGMVPNTICVYCGVYDEDMDHLFFLCPIIKPVWDSFLTWYNLPMTGTNWEETKVHAYNLVKGKRPKARVFKVFFTEFVYTLWIERNNRLFKDTSRSPNVLRREITGRAVGRCQLHEVLRLYCASLSSYPLCL